MINNEWNLVGASAIGTSHLKLGNPCQDAFAYKQFPNGTAIIALSDGAGSAAKAKESAGFLVKTALVSLENQLLATSDGQTIIRTAFEETRAALELYVSDMAAKESSAELWTLRDYAATLLLVVLAKDWAVGGLIGDCVAVTLNESGELLTMCKPQKGEYANTTNFITQDNALEQLDIQILAESVQGAAVFSDGLLSLTLNMAENKPHPPFFNPLFAFTAAINDESIAEQQLTNFLNSERVNTRTDDDKTLILARRK